MYVSDNISWRRKEDLESVDLKILYIKIIVKNSDNFLLCSAYRPPDSSDYLSQHFNGLFDNFLKNVYELPNEVILLGDLNANYLKKDNSKELKSIISTHNYKQLIDSSKRITNNTSTLIDVFLTNISKNIKDVIIAPLSLSDHDLIGWGPKLNNQNTKNQKQ